MVAGIVLILPWKKFFYRSYLNFGPIYVSELAEEERVFLTKEFLLRLISHFKKTRMLALRFLPSVINAEYDDITRIRQTDEGRELEHVLKTLCAHRINQTLYEDSSLQLHYTYVKNIDGMDFDTVVKSISPKARNKFNRYGKNGVDVRFVDINSMEPLMEVLKEVASRTDMPEVQQAQMNYYRELIKAFGSENAFLLVAILNTTKSLSQIKEERKNA